MRAVIAFAFYFLGDLVWRVFDRWTGAGIQGPIYRFRSGLMSWSDRVQGDGPGPWFSGDDMEVASGRGR
jgi:hypothetical protein